jgi:hypothetical protein
MIEYLANIFHAWLFLYVLVCIKNNVEYSKSNIEKRNLQVLTKRAKQYGIFRKTLYKWKRNIEDGKPVKPCGKNLKRLRRVLRAKCYYG